MQLIQMESCGLHFVADITTDGKARLIHFSPKPFDMNGYREEDYHRYYTLLELHGIGCDTNDHHASRHTYTSPATELRYIKHETKAAKDGKLLQITLSDGALEVILYYQFYYHAAVVRCYTTVTNTKETPFTIDYITSFAYYGLSAGCEKWDQESQLYIPHNSWHGELQWRKNTPWELGLSKLNRSSLKKLSYHQTGTWSSSEYIPMGVFTMPAENVATYWQIENNGSWYWECSDVLNGGLYLQLCGPNNEYNHFRKTLNIGDSFTTVPVAVGTCFGGFEEAVGELTTYRRTIRRPNPDNENLPVIFNDYMNCMMGDPSTERLLPLIEAAAEVGSEYFVVDAGWFTENIGGDDFWWDSIGVWKESKRRFPNGFSEVFDAVRKKGMHPGLWIEIEGIGPDSPLAETIPDDWFFQINGKRVVEHHRYQLDWRNEDVRRFATRTLEEMIEKYGLRYLKIDYNINAGLGTDLNEESAGSGVLAHCRAYLSWLDQFLTQHPDLVIENCASGGQRMDYAMLSRLSIQSTSDQTDYRQYAAISSMASTAVTPEQAAVWSYPHYEGDEEETVFNMVNAMLGRVHQSGFLNILPSKNFDRVKEGIACYKSIRKDVKTALPVYPLGLIWLHSPWAATGLRCEHKLYLSVWRKTAQEDTVNIPLPCLAGKSVKITCMYPNDLPVQYGYCDDTATLTVTLPQQMSARFFLLEF